MTALEGDDEDVPISALQHFLYCPRQCALIHLDQAYDDNVFTLRGNRVHQHAHEPQQRFLQGVHVEHALPLQSGTLGLTGKADVVEFLDDGTPYPVEYKAGARKPSRADDVQLCAQAMCLEEMLGVPVPEGGIYYHRSRRRRTVSFDADLRDLVLRTVTQVRELLGQARLPPPVADTRCVSCSLKDTCMPNEILAWSARTGGLFAVEDAL